MTHVEQAERDAHGRWRRGSGNPAGRPRGAKNRRPRRRAGDRERVAEWRLARMMGGDVTVASEPGKGSVFTVRLPGGERT